MSIPKVSIIVPIYKAESFIEKCIRSLFEQSLSEIEYIFINDNSPDESINIINQLLKEYPNRQNQTIIINHIENEGVSKSRQEGIDIASGEYIIHCDPDDWVEVDMYEKMYSLANIKQADIVICDFYNEHKDVQEIIHQNYPQNKTELFRLITEHKLHMAFWNKLINSKIAKKFRLYENINLWEDMSVVPLLLLSSSKILSIAHPYYHYNLKNSNSITQSLDNNKLFSRLNAVTSLSKNLMNSGLIQFINISDLLRFQWDVKRFLLDSPNIKNINSWNNLLPEASKKYKSIGLPKKSQILSFLASKRMTQTMKVLLFVLSILKRRKNSIII